MKQSPPAAAASPDDSAPSEERRAEEEKPRVERRRLRVPTSVLVTLLVALLSVWVGPAFARQWDDRQKANELKAALAEEIATTTARTLAAGLEVSRSEDAERLDRWEEADARWQIARFSMKMKLAAYFGPAAGEDWDQFANDVRNFLFICDLAPAGERARAYVPWVRPDPAMRQSTTAELLDPIVVRVEEVTPKGEDLVYNREDVSDWAASITSNEKLRDTELEWLMGYLFVLAEQQTAAVLDAHAEGYSTTRRDLLRDLLP